MPEIDLSVVVPVYNSEPTLLKLHRRLTDTLTGMGLQYELIFVEDAGNDQSWKVIEDLARTDQRIIGIQHMVNYGQGLTTLDGIFISKGRFVVTIDDDLQYYPEDIVELYASLTGREDLDIIIGNPIRRRDPLIRRIGSSLVNLMNSIFLKKALGLRFSGFRIMRRQVAHAMSVFRVPYPALGPLLLLVTHRIENKDVRHQVRSHGQSNYSFLRLIRQTTSNVLSHSVAPLRIIGLLGFWGIVAAFFCGCFFLSRYILLGTRVPGFTALALLILVFGSFNLFAFAVIGEYLKRIFHVQTIAGRPLVRNRVNARLSDAGTGPL